MLPVDSVKLAGIQKNMANDSFLWISGTMERMKGIWFIRLRVYPKGGAGFLMLFF